MRRSVIAIAFVAVAAMGVADAGAQTERRGVLSDILSGITRPTTTAATQQRDAASALREALTNGVVAATTRLGRVDGFFRDGRVHIPLPGTLASAQRGLKPLGLSAPLDDLELKVNRAAEAAMPQARTLIVDAVRSITFSDALSIVRGGDDAGTRYLRQRTETRLTELLRPHMQDALQRSGAFAALDNAVSRSRLNAGTAVGKLRGDMINFAVAKALDGAFAYVADEEKAIRSDPAKRTSDILRRVFGA